MNVALSKFHEDFIQRIISSGRYTNASEVVRAGLRILEEVERSDDNLVYPSGSLLHLYTKEEDEGERGSAGVSSMHLESE
jgi:putative addiction module CopG family antidote